jgi:hypothetical protein
MGFKWGQGSFVADPSRPWTTAGGPDPAVADDVRNASRRRLTDASLVDQFRELDAHAPIAYGRMIRELELVWDCPRDEAVNVFGYLCAECHRDRDAALTPALGRKARMALRRLAVRRRISGPRPSLPSQNVTDTREY